MAGGSGRAFIHVLVEVIDMTAKELAEKLDGREYRHEITREEKQQAKDNGLVVVYGYSDDNVEFDGAISDEVGCYEGATVYVTAEGVVKLDNPDCEEYAESCAAYKYYKQHVLEHAKAIKAVWCPPDTDFSWVYETDIPHETFRILEDGEHYCLGIVFSVEDL